MNEEMRDEILADAIEQYINAERKILKLEKENFVLWCLVGIAIASAFLITATLIGG